MGYFEEIKKGIANSKPMEGVGEAVDILKTGAKKASKAAKEIAGDVKMMGEMAVEGTQEAADTAGKVIKTYVRHGGSPALPPKVKK